MSKLRVAMITRKDRWTEQELIDLKRLYREAPLDELLNALPCRSYRAIRKEASVLGLCRGNYIPVFDKLPIYTPSIAERTWLAAAIDCDGNISLVKRMRHDLANKFNLLPYLQFSNTNKKLVQEFINRTFPNELKISTIWRAEKSRGKHKDKHCAQITQMPLTYSLLVAIEPYLIAKREQANNIIEFIKIEDKVLRDRVKYRHHYWPRQLELFRENRALNSRGVTVE